MLSSYTEQTLKYKTCYYLIKNKLLYKSNSHDSQRPLRVLKPYEIEPILYIMYSDSLFGYFEKESTY